MSKPKPVTIADLPDSPRGVFLVCSRAGCIDRAMGNHYSASRGDYFWMPAGQPFRCGRCHAPLMLAREQRKIVAA